jgi:hypothetical protein
MCFVIPSGVEESPIFHRDEDPDLEEEEELHEQRRAR